MNIHLFAQTPIPVGGGIGGEGLGPFGKIIQEITGFSPELGGFVGLLALIRVISSIIGVITIAGGIWFLFNFLIGGLQWLGSGGDKHNLEQAQQRITNAFVGLIIVVAGWTILALVSTFTGVDFLFRHPMDIITNVFPGGVNPNPTPP